VGFSCSYLVRPSPFSAQKTFERHNSRRKSNISFCSQTLIQQMAAASQAGSRRGSGLGLTGYQSPRPPPLSTTKSNSLSLPDSPTVAGYQRGRSNSLRVIDDILLRRSNSLRQGLTSVGSGRRKSSLEDIGLSHFSTNYHNPIKIALNGSIGLEVTPPEENSPPVISSNTAMVVNAPLPAASHTGSTMSLAQSGLPSSSSSLPQPLNLGINVPTNFGEAGPVQQAALPPPASSATDPQHLQGTIV
jgi:potassium channel subfamily T protein 1